MIAITRNTLSIVSNSSFVYIKQKKNIKLSNIENQTIWSKFANSTKITILKYKKKKIKKLNKKLKARNKISKKSKKITKKIYIE